MGWSCTVDADKTLEKIQTFCKKLTGISNEWIKDGDKYFFDIGKEQKDGSITGNVYQIIDRNMAVKIGFFKISANGKIISFPKLPKEFIFPPSA